MKSLRFRVPKIQLVEHASSFSVGFLIIFILSIFIWLVWRNYGDHLQVPPINLWVAAGIILLNVLLALWTISREIFASYLLIGATITAQILAIIFLYMV